MKIYSTVKIFIITIALILSVYLISIFFLLYEPTPSEKINSECLDLVEYKLRDRTSLTLDFNEVVTCFEWDTMFVTSSSRWENYPDLEFTYIGNMYKGKESKNVIDWVDGHRNWSCIFFLKNDDTIPNAFVICQTELYLRNLWDMKFSRNKTRFEVGEEELDGRFRKLKIIE